MRAAGLIAAILATAALQPATMHGAQAAACLETTALDKTRPAVDALVEQICTNDQSVNSAPGILVQLPNGARDPKPVTKGNGYTSGTTFSTPASTVADFITRTGNQIRAFNGASWTVEVSPRGGDFINVASGKLRFFVQRALGAFSVYAAPVYGLVPGTVFDVDLNPGAAVTYSVSDGRVRLTRNVTIHLTAENRNVDGIRQSDYISATGPEPNTLTYKLPLGIFMTFANAAEAERYFTKQLQDASSTGDQPGIEDSLMNIERVRGPIPPAAFENSIKPAPNAPPVAPVVTSIILPVAVAGAILGVIASSHSTSSPSTGSQLNSGTVVVHGHARRVRLHTIQISIPIRL